MRIVGALSVAAALLTVGCNKQAEADLATCQGELTKTQQEVTTAKSSVTAAEAQVTELTAQLKTAQDEVAAYKAKEEEAAAAAAAAATAGKSKQQSAASKAAAEKKAVEAKTQQVIRNADVQAAPAQNATTRQKAKNLGF